MKTKLEKTLIGLRALNLLVKLDDHAKLAVGFLFYLWTGLGIVFGAAFATLVALNF